MTFAMAPEQILRELSKRHRKPPMQALQAAMEQRDAVAPLMLDELDLLLAGIVTALWACGVLGGRVAQRG